MQDYLRPNFQRLRSEPEDVMRTAFERAHKAIYEAIKRQPDTFEQVRVCPLAAGARVSVSMSWGECPAPAPFTRSKRQIPRAKGPVRPPEGLYFLGTATPPSRGAHQASMLHSCAEVRERIDPNRPAANHTLPATLVQG